jgi:hypothetical protein
MKPFIPKEWVRMRKQPHTGIRKSPFVKSGLEDGHGREIKPPYSPGEVCWVRERWGITGHPDPYADTIYGVQYKSDGAVLYPYYPIESHFDVADWSDIGKWRSPVTMPQWASRRHVRILSCVPEQRGEWGWRIEWEKSNAL